MGQGGGSHEKFHVAPCKKQACFLEGPLPLGNAGNGAFLEPPFASKNVLSWWNFSWRPPFCSHPRGESHTKLDTILASRFPELAGSPLASQNSPALPRKFSADLPETFLALDFQSNPEVAWKFPKLPRTSPEIRSQPQSLHIQFLEYFAVTKTVTVIEIKFPWIKKGSRNGNGYAKSAHTIRVPPGIDRDKRQRKQNYSWE